MIDVSEYCGQNETIAGIEENSVGCVTYIVAKPGRGENDRVLLDIRDTPTAACILIGGNQFKIETLHGFGRMALVDVKSGETKNIFLEPGVEVDIPTGFIYSYSNCGETDSQLILRDTSEDFQLTDEVAIADLTTALTMLSPLPL